MSNNTIIKLLTTAVIVDSLAEKVNEYPLNQSCFVFFSCCRAP